MPEFEVHRDSSSFSFVRLVLLLVELVLGAMVLILGAAFFMSLLGANPDAEFASWIYSRTDSIMQPFNGIFPDVEISSGTHVNLSLLFAMAVYAVIGSALEGVVRRL